MSGTEVNSLVVTALMDDNSFTYFDNLRRKHFPAGLNKVPAHICLFHKLPGALLDNIATDLKAVLDKHVDNQVETSGIMFLGRGVAFKVEAPGLQSLQSTIATLYRDHLTGQDQQPFWPHITVQNKVEPKAARNLADQLKSSFSPRRFTIIGIALWFYRESGTWDRAAVLPWPSRIVS